LAARGTPEQGILFTSESVAPLPGDWDEIRFNDSSADYNPGTGEGSVLENVVIEYAGGQGRDRMVVVESASPLIRNCVFRNGTDNGLEVRNGAAPVVEGNTFETVRFGLYLHRGAGGVVKGNTFRKSEWAVEMAPDCDVQFEGNVAVDNVHNGIRVTGGEIPAAATWYANLPYIPDGDIRVPRDAVLTIQPGAQIRFNGDHNMSVDGTLVARGTPEQRILFTSESVAPLPGDWDEIRFNDSSADYDAGSGKGCVLEYATVEYGGGAGRDRLMLIEACAPLIKGCVFRQAAADGIVVRNGASPILQGNAFEGIWGETINVSGDSTPIVQ
jgi:hypothetical protein